MNAYGKHRVSGLPGKGWSWLAYALVAFAAGVGLSYCTLHVIETAAKVAL